MIRPDSKKPVLDLPSLGYWLLALIYWETLLHALALGAFRPSFGYALGFTLSIAALIALAVSFLPGRGKFPVELVLTLFFIFLYGSQLVYRFIFGTLYSVALVGQGGEAITVFWRETLATMAEHIPQLLLLFVPLVGLLMLHRFRKNPTRPGWLWRGCLAVLALAAFFATEQALTLGGTGMFSDYSYYHGTTIATNQTTQRFGLLTTLRLELRQDGDGEDVEETYFILAETECPQEESATAETLPVTYNVLDIDFDQLNEEADSKKIKAINNYCAQLTGTNQNAYTGRLADYNLLVFCAESFSTGAIDPELTPTLYKLATEGFRFTNYYNSFPNTTTDGEYALTQGLWPDSSRNKAVSSLYASRNSYLPFTLGNALAEQRGINCRGYHNYLGSYYGRNKSHPNMGYTMKFAGSGMTFSSRWPASDLEMMEQSIDDYLGQEQFHAYYMTFSGHYKYDPANNSIAEKNWDLVKDLPYTSDAIKAYLSCNIELDRALEYTLNRLEEAGVAEKTAIVLVGDHFPYGLEDGEYSELIGYDIDAFSKFKSTFILWVGDMEEPVTVEDYCCNVDVLPTLLNLWGLEFDSRMLAGTDIFSDGTHVAILSDKSWLTEKARFNADTGEAELLVPEEELPEGYVETMNMTIATRFSISADILNQAYYNFAFGKEKVWVNRKSWSN